MLAIASPRRRCAPASTSRLSLPRILIRGRISAGGPLEPCEEPEPRDLIPSLFPGLAEYTVALVDDDCLLAASIKRGDVLLLHEGKVRGVVRAAPAAILASYTHVASGREPKVTETPATSPPKRVEHDGLQVWIVEETEPFSGKATLAPVLYAETLSEAEGFAETFNRDELTADKPLHAWAIVRRPA